MSRLKREGSIDEKTGKGDKADEDLVMDVSLDGLGLSNGCATVGTCTLQE